MMILDACVVSEAIKPRADRRVMEWLDSVDEDALYLSAIALGN